MATGKKFYWLKLKRDFFKRHDIRIIEGMPNGKDYVLFYLKLLVESIDHDGMLRFSDTIPYDENMLATITNTNIDIVRAALSVFQKLELLEVLDDQTIYMREVQTMIGSETDYARKMREWRSNKRLEEHTEEQGEDETGYIVTDVGATTSNGVRQEIEKEIEIDNISTPIGVDTSHFSKKCDASPSEMRTVVEAWNSLGLKKITKLVPETERYIMLKKRIADYGLESVLSAIENVRNSRFLNGNNEKGFACTFDWFVRPNNFPKILDGNYNDADKPKLDERAYSGAKWLAETIAERVSDFQMPSPQELDKWAEDLDALHRSGYKWKQISNTAVWAVNDDFWRPIIVSGAALRKNFVKILSRKEERCD